MNYYVARYIALPRRYEFFSGGSWVDDHRHATPFPDETSAVNACEALAHDANGPYTVCSEDEFE